MTLHLIMIHYYNSSTGAMSHNFYFTQYAFMTVLKVTSIMVNTLSVLIDLAGPTLDTESP